MHFTQRGSIMPIIGIDHGQLVMPPGQEDVARAFYACVLGLTAFPKPAALPGRRGGRFTGAQWAAAGFTPRDQTPICGFDRVNVDDRFGNRIASLEPPAG